MTSLYNIDQNKAVWTNYARDLSLASSLKGLPAPVSRFLSFLLLIDALSHSHDIFSLSLCCKYHQILALKVQ